MSNTDEVEVFIPTPEEDQGTVKQAAARAQTLQIEGFEQFTNWKDKHGNKVLSYAKSGRFAYLHIHPASATSFKKIKRAIGKVFRELADTEGLIVDIRTNKNDLASQAAWLTYIEELNYTNPIMVISPFQVNVPQHWQVFYPQNSVLDYTDAARVRSFEYRAKPDKEKDKLILSALRTLRSLGAHKSFGLI